MTSFIKIDDNTLQATDPLMDSYSEWGAPRLRRIFNFRSRQVTSIYERGGLQETYPSREYNSKTGYTAAVTSSMQIQNFRDIEGQDDIAAMHAQLKELGGHPPPIDDILPRLAKTGLSPKNWTMIYIF